MKLEFAAWIRSRPSPSIRLRLSFSLEPEPELGRRSVAGRANTFDPNMIISLKDCNVLATFTNRTRI
jgi:hypothetical protein